MNVIHFDQGRCASIRGYLDSYLSNELLVETNHAVLKHLEICQGCGRELEERRRLRETLRRAAVRETAPPALRMAISKAIREERSDRAMTRRQWAAIAAMVVVAAGGALASGAWSRYREQLAGVLGIGVTDHIRCAMAGHFPQEPPSAAEMKAAMGPGYFAAAALAEEKLPGYRLREGHRCEPGGRPYVHVILSRDDKLASIVLTSKRHGESFPRSRLAAALRASGGDLYHGQAEGLEVAGFETKEHLAFVVSNLDSGENMRIAAALAPDLQRLLRRIEA